MIAGTISTRNPMDVYKFHLWASIIKVTEKKPSEQLFYWAHRDIAVGLLALYAIAQTLSADLRKITTISKDLRSRIEDIYLDPNAAFTGRTKPFILTEVCDSSHAICAKEVFGEVECDTRVFVLPVKFTVVNTIIVLMQRSDRPIDTQQFDFEGVTVLVFITPPIKGKGLELCKVEENSYAKHDDDCISKDAVVRELLIHFGEVCSFNRDAFPDFKVQDYNVKLFEALNFELLPAYIRDIYDAIFYFKYDRSHKKRSRKCERLRTDENTKNYRKRSPAGRLMRSYKVGLSKEELNQFSDALRVLLHNLLCKYQDVPIPLYQDQLLESICCSIADLTKTNAVTHPYWPRVLMYLIKNHTATVEAIVIRDGNKSYFRILAPFLDEEISELSVTHICLKFFENCPYFTSYYLDLFVNLLGMDVDTIRELGELQLTMNDDVFSALLPAAVPHTEEELSQAADTLYKLTIKEAQNVSDWYTPYIGFDAHIEPKICNINSTLYAHRKVDDSSSIYDTLFRDLYLLPGKEK